MGFATSHSTDSEVLCTIYKQTSRILYFCWCLITVERNLHAPAALLIAPTTPAPLEVSQAALLRWFGDLWGGWMTFGVAR